MSDAQLEEMGPIDYMVLEWDGDQPVTGAAPLGWGTAEPANQPWSAREVTEFCRERAPQPTALVVVASGGIFAYTARLEMMLVGASAAASLRQTSLPSAYQVVPDGSIATP